MVCEFEGRCCQCAQRSTMCCTDLLIMKHNVKSCCCGYIKKVFSELLPCAFKAFLCKRRGARFKGVFPHPKVHFGQVFPLFFGQMSGGRSRYSKRGVEGSLASHGQEGRERKTVFPSLLPARPLFVCVVGKHGTETGSSLSKIRLLEPSGGGGVPFNWQLPTSTVLPAVPLLEPQQAIDKYFEDDR